MAIAKSTHRILIGWLNVGIAMLLAVFVVFVWKKAFGIEAATHTQGVIKYTLLVAMLFFAVGLSLLLDYRRSAWICLPFSVALLIYFPIGTVLGGYYLWYFWKYIYRRKAG
jgi:hypothetical protein